MATAAQSAPSTAAGPPQPDPTSMVAVGRGTAMVGPGADAGLATGVALPRPTALGTLGSLGGILGQPAVRKAMPAIIGLAMLVIVGVIYAWMQDAPYRPVFPGMVEADQQTALETLKAANFSPRIDVSSGQVTVPNARYHEARILLASQGIPRVQGRGILESLKDQSAMTTSQFMEQARYSAAVEQELAKSITQIATIQSARVHLAQVKQSNFMREQAPVKASVVVTPFSGRQVTANQVQAIIHLVASSVAYLSAENVSVVDNLGNLISKAPGEGPLGLTSLQAQHRQQAEETYRSRIVQLLEPVVGEGNVRAQVDLVMDFTQVETASEDFDNKGAGTKTRSEVLSEERTSKLDPQGVPGALSNTVPPESKATPDTAASAEKADARGAISSKSTRNYELDKTVRHVKSAQGSIQRVSVAVVVKDRPPPAAAPAAAAAPAKDGASPAPPAGYSPQEVERMTTLVKGVVGFNAPRGDVVSLIPAKFEPSGNGNSPPWYENELVVNGLKLAIPALVIVAFLFAVVRPVLKSYLPPDKVVMAALPEGGGGAAEAEAEAEGAADITLAEGESLEDFKARLKKSAAPKKSSISADMLDTANTYDDKVALVRMLVQDDAGRVASVLKNMIKKDLPS